MNMTGKCDVCGQETEVYVASSTCGAISFAYCEECLIAHREPYDALVSMGVYFDEISESYKEAILLPSLKFYNKTPAEFDADVDKDLDDYYAYMHYTHKQGIEEWEL